jgi:Zn-dependent protease with chaperone function
VRVPWSYGPEALPELFRLVDEVAGTMGTRGIDRVVVTHDPCFGVFTLPAGLRRRRRHLVVGLPYVYALSLDDLRAVLAHELAHLRLGHDTSGRLTWHFIRRMQGRLEAMSRGAFASLSPVYWSTALSLWLLSVIYHPWHRLQEYEADRLSAHAAGANHAISALRKIREALPAILFSQSLLVDAAQADAVAPSHLGEAAARLSTALPARLRKQLSLRGEGDPLDLEGRTHPPTPQRIAALHGLPQQPARHPEVAARYLPDLRALEAHVTGASLRAKTVEPPRAAAERALARLVKSSAEAQA